MTTYTKLITTIPTVLMGGLIINGNDIANVNFDNRYPTYVEQESSALSEISQTHYATISSSNTNADKLEIIHQFASTLLENIEDLDPEFSQVIDENYWDLI